MASSTQESCVKILKKKKVKLARWLSTDFQVILQHAHSGEIVDDRVYQRLMNTAQPYDACIVLIDSVIFRGEGPSSDFLELLKDPEIHSTYNTELKDWILSLEPPGQTKPNITHPVASGSKHFKKKSPDKELSVKKNDDLQSVVSREAVHADITPQARVKRTAESAKSSRATDPPRVEKKSCRLCGLVYPPDYEEEHMESHWDSMTSLFD